MSYRTHGLVKGDATIGKVVPVAASQYFWHGYGCFVALNSSGHVTIALTATQKLYGWAFVPSTGTGAGELGSKYWLSSSSAATDEVFVCTDPNAWFSLPAYSTAGSVAAIPDVVDINGTNDGTTAGQTVDVGTSTHNILRIMDYDKNDTSVIFVKMNVLELQTSN